MSRVISAVGVCLLFAAPFACADTVQVNIDYTQDPANPNSDFEGSSYWTSFDGTTAFLGTRGGQASKGYIKWHIPALAPPAGFSTLINNATMTWFCNALPANPDLQATLYKVADNSWTHLTIGQYGAGRPTMGDAILTFRPAGTALENPVTHDLTAYLQEVVDAGGTIMSLGADAPADGNANSYIRMDGPTAAGSWLVPYLDVNYEFVPEPATMALLVMGSLGVLCRRKRR